MITHLKNSMVIVATVILAACSHTTTTHGHVIKDKHLKEIRIGLHDRNDVASLLGSPSAMSTFSDKTWYYLTEKTVSKPLSPNQLEERRLITVEFADNGTVKEIKEQDQNAGKDIARKEKTTPTHGQSLGVIDQLFGNIGVGGF